jgi:hypothetical protein
MPERKRVLAKLMAFVQPHVNKYRSAVYPTAKNALVRKRTPKLAVDHALEATPGRTPPPRRLPPLLDSSNNSVPQGVWDRINDASLKLDLSRISALCDETNSAAAELQDSLASVDELNLTVDARNTKSNEHRKSDQHRKASFPSGDSTVPGNCSHKDLLPQQNRIALHNSRVIISGPKRTAALTAHTSVLNTVGASDEHDINSAAVKIQAIQRGNSKRAEMSRASDRSVVDLSLQIDAAIRIQCVFRCQFASQVMRTRLAEKKLQQPAVVQAWSPTCMSSPVTGVRAEQIMAVVTLQAWWRMIKVRLWMAYWRFCKETMAAVKLQSWSRMIIAIKTLAVRRQERRASLRIEI